MIFQEIYNLKIYKDFAEMVLIFFLLCSIPESARISSFGHETLIYLWLSIV